MVSDSDAGCFPKLGRIRKENGLGAKGLCDECGERRYRSGETFKIVPCGMNRLRMLTK